MVYSPERPFHHHGTGKKAAPSLIENRPRRYKNPLPGYSNPEISKLSEEKRLTSKRSENNVTQIEYPGTQGLAMGKPERLTKSAFPGISRPDRKERNNTCLRLHKLGKLIIRKEK
ncbi:MAG: hypothetical protein PHH07_08375 [Candidatus Cloacimonetes bacterium]|nr:hypothetical protein [Candidatus Cloacimonadota bacterium]